MAILTQLVLHILVILTLVKDCSAYCYGYCWYGSWYIWFAVIMTIAICCGALGSYLRRRRIQQALRAQQSEVITVQVGGHIEGGMVPPTSDLSRPYVYPQGTTAYPAYQGPAAMTPPPYNAAVATSDPSKKQADDFEGLPPSYFDAVQQGSYQQPPQGAYPSQPQSSGYNQAQAPYPTQPQSYPTAPHNGEPPYPNK